MSAPAASHHEYDDYTPAQRWVILSALMLGTLMTVIDASIVNVAIPTMMGNLGATLGQISWVSTGYIIASVIMLPLTGWLSVRFGRKRFLAVSMIIFTLASLFCGTSRTLGELVFFRIMQGVGSAALLSTAQAAMMEIFPPKQIGMVQAIYGIGVMVGPTLGPTLGGWITDNYNWPWIFFINLPIGALATFLTLTFVHNSRHKLAKGATVDLTGIALLAMGLGALQYMLEKGNEENWFQSSMICWLALTSFVSLLAFVFWELRVEHPAVNLRVLRHKQLWAGCLYGATIGLGLYGGMFILPVFLQQLRHYTAMQTGMIMVPGAIATAIMMPIVGKLSSKVSPRNLVAVGTVVFIIATLMLRVITTETGPNDIFLALVLRGFAMGLIFVPLSLATLMGLKGRDLGEGAGLFALARQLGGSAGIAILSTFIEHRQAAHAATLSEHISVYNPIAVQRLSALVHFFQSKGSSLLIAKQQALTALTGIVKGQAAVLSFIDAFVFITIAFLATMPLLLLFKNRLPGHAPATAPVAE